jgi:poly(3-hydroxybutyrate) depolymerase
VKSRFAISVPHWGVTGYSTGGWCAAMIGMLHPDRYVATGVIAGYFRPQIGISVSGSEFNSLQSKYNLLSLAKNHPPATNVMVVTSAQDRAGRADSLQFIAAARPPLVVTQLSLLKGGHNTIVWRGIEPELFKWFGKILDADPQSLGAWSSGG